MKNFLLIILFFVVVGQAVGQADSVAKKTAFKNQFDLNAELLGVELIYNQRISKNLFIGTGFGIGLFFYPTTKGGIIESFRYKILLGKHFSEKVKLYVGLKYAPGVFVVEKDNVTSILGVESGIFYKTPDFEFGFNLSLIWGKESIVLSRELSSSLLILKFPLYRFSKK